MTDGVFGFSGLHCFSHAARATCARFEQEMHASVMALQQAIAGGLEQSILGGPPHCFSQAARSALARREHAMHDSVIAMQHMRDGGAEQSTLGVIGSTGVVGAHFLRQAAWAARARARHASHSGVNALQQPISGWLEQLMGGSAGVAATLKLPVQRTRRRKVMRTVPDCALSGTRNSMKPGVMRVGWVCAEPANQMVTSRPDGTLAKSPRTTTVLPTAPEVGSLGRNAGAGFWRSSGLRGGGSAKPSPGGGVRGAGGPAVGGAGWGGAVRRQPESEKARRQESPQSDVDRLRERVMRRW